MALFWHHFGSILAAAVRFFDSGRVKPPHTGYPGTSADLRTEPKPTLHLLPISDERLELLLIPVAGQHFHTIRFSIWRPAFCMLAQNENVGTPPEKRDMVEGCLSIGFCVRAGRKWCFPFFRWLSQISGGGLLSTKGKDTFLRLN